MLGAPGFEQQQWVPWLMMPWVVAAGAGVWAVDHYTGRWIGAWRVFPMVLLGGYGLVLAVFFVLSLATAGSLRLTDSHLVARRPWSRQRWAWNELRDIRVLTVDHSLYPHLRPETDPETGLVREPTDSSRRILALVPERGPAVVLPRPFQDGDPDRTERLAEQLRAALHRYRPEAEPLDGEAAHRASREVLEDLEARERRRARNDRYSFIAAVLAIGAGCVVRIVQVQLQARGGQSWLPSVTVVLFGIALLVQLSLNKGHLARIPRLLRRVNSTVLWMTGGVLLLLAVKGG